MSTTGSRTRQGIFLSHHTTITLMQQLKREKPLNF